jgi:tyrosinase
MAGASALATFGAPVFATAQGRTVTRRSVRGMTANDPDLAAYRRAVAAMKALPASDPRNWNRFADIHRDFCPHANWYFLPWHRAYLLALERICRDLSGKADFALPYWDWTAQRSLPPAFTAGNPQSNPLNHRRPGGDFTLADDMVGAAVIARVLASPDFEAFGSARPRGQNSAGAQWQRREGAKTEFEFNPHDGVHATVGGDMARVATAARDPIFYLHHSNVDRIWATWNARGNNNSPEANWRNFSFNDNFVNPDGTRSSAAVDELQSTPALGYRYDGEAIGLIGQAAEAFAADPVYVNDDPSPDRIHAYRRVMHEVAPAPGRGARAINLPSGPAYVASAVIDPRGHATGVTVPLGRPLSELISLEALAQARSPGPGARRGRRYVWATLYDMEPPAEPAARVRMFANCGDLAPQTDARNPHYATSMSFFGNEHVEHHAGHGGHHGGHGAARGVSVLVDLTPTLARIATPRSIHTDKIVVQLQRSTGNAMSASGRPRRVDIAII